MGLIQNLLTSRSDKFRQIQRNFNETYYIVIICFLITLALGSIGDTAQKAAVFYLVGRLLYVLLTLLNQLRLRKIAWALSIVGVAGWVIVAIRSAIDLLQ